MTKLGQYMLQDNEEWQIAKEKAQLKNQWFQPVFIDLSIRNIAQKFLQKDILQNWCELYPDLNDERSESKTIGIVMAGNIPLVGFQDFLCVFIAGHKSLIKVSSKDDVLIKHLAEKVLEWSPELEGFFSFSEMLKNCDAYIATGGNSSAGYFDYYFGKYPNIIRRNRTSVAILTGEESDEELSLLADDIYLFFGMGCRNITKIYVPQHFDFVRLIDVLKKYDFLADHHKFKNNYDYNLAIHILNNKKYMSNASLLIVEDANIFSPVSQLNYEYYSHVNEVAASLKENDDVQCIVGKGFVPFGKAQQPEITDYADGVDVMQWLIALGK